MILKLLSIFISISFRLNTSQVQAQESEIESIEAAGKRFYQESLVNVSPLATLFSDAIAIQV